MRLFVDVAVLRSFSKAAARHAITQSAVSQRVRQLEERLGVELLDRTVHPFELTPAGALSYSRTVTPSTLSRAQSLLRHAMKEYSPALPGSTSNLVETRAARSLIPATG